MKRNRRRHNMDPTPALRAETPGGLFAFSARDLYVTFLGLEFVANSAPEASLRKDARRLADRIQTFDQQHSPEPSFMVIRGDADDLDDDDDDEAEPPR